MLDRIKSASPKVVAVTGVVALVALGGGSAAAKSLITGGDVKNGSLSGADLRTGSVSGADIKNGSLHLADLDPSAVKKLSGSGVKGQPGRDGKHGANGKDGANGRDGKDAAYVGADWSIVDRNVIGNGDSFLRSGPDGGAGQGSLGIRTGSASDKAAFGNQAAFRNMPVAALNQVGFSVFTTGENNGLGSNMPSIVFEIDPNLSSNPTDFS